MWAGWGWFLILSSRSQAVWRAWCVFRRKRWGSGRICPSHRSFDGLSARSITCLDISWIPNYMSRLIIRIAIYRCARIFRGDADVAGLCCDLSCSRRLSHIAAALQRVLHAPSSRAGIRQRVLGADAGIVKVRGQGGVGMTLQAPDCTLGRPS